MLLSTKKLSDHSSKAIGVTQSQSIYSENQGPGFQDNRKESLIQKRLKHIAQTSSSTSPGISRQIVQQKSNKTGLPDQLKSGIEQLSNHSLDDVRVHYNSSKPTQLNAHAFAQGSDIHVATGQEQHLPHEAWHVVQQKQGRVKPTMKLEGLAINDNVALEKEADHMGGKALQLKEVEPQTLLNPLEVPGNVVQPKWIDSGKKYLMWEFLVDGVRWYSDPESGDMFYIIEKPKQITLGSLEDYREMEGPSHIQPRERWMDESDVGDILGELDASVVEKKDLKKGVVDTRKLKYLPKMVSQFKHFFVSPTGRLLAVFKDADTNKAVKEVAALSRIGAAGLPTPNPKLIDVVHRGKKTIGIEMDFVKGVFVDIAKIGNKSLLGFVLNMASQGKKVNTSEAGIMKYMRHLKSKWPQEKQENLANLKKDLTRILQLSKDVVINDLQLVVTKTGKVVVIDPQWAGNPKAMINAEVGFVRATYEKIAHALQELEKGTMIGDLTL